MKRLFLFQKKKFITLPSRSQHKKCSELLRHYLDEIDPEEKRRLEMHYQELVSWMQQDLALPSSKKELADRYHWHLALANMQHKEHNLLPVIEKGDRLDADPFLHIDIYLDGLRSLHNIGSIVRTTEALRLGNILLSKSMQPIEQQSLAKCAMGTEAWVELGVARSIEELKQPLIALETTKDALPYYEFLYPNSFTLALGNEEYGLSDEVLQKADAFIKIPLYGRKNSLNVANAFAIVASEIVKQKRSKHWDCESP
jgi:tRNA G18 (ribose-2'-O)-methylase SpoU